jgi:hypothetical protein
LKDCQRLKEADQTCMAVVRSVAVEVWLVLPVMYTVAATCYTCSEIKLIICWSCWKEITSVW